MIEIRRINLLSVDSAVVLGREEACSVERMGTMGVGTTSFTPCKAFYDVARPRKCPLTKRVRGFCPSHVSKAYIKAVTFSPVRIHGSREVIGVTRCRAAA